MPRLDILVIHPLPLCREAIVATIRLRRPLLTVADAHPDDVPEPAPARVLLLPGEPTIVLMPDPPAPRRVTCASLDAMLTAIDDAIGESPV